MRLARLGLTLAAGIAMVVSACSSPVPPTPQGAYDVQFEDPAGTCSIAGHNSQVGVVDAMNRTTVVVDGTAGAAVNCSVTGAGPFNVSGQIQLGGDSLQIQVNSLAASATKASPAPGAVGFTSPNTVKTYSTDSMHPCNFYFIPGSQEAVASGKVWVAFNCPEISNEDTGTDDTCALLESYVLLENCTTM